MSISHVLTIAGSDPSGGAGIQADLKTFSALGVYGCAVLTSLTAQSTQGVTGVHPVPSGFVREQVETLVADVRIDAVKVGMLGTAEVVREVSALIDEGALARVVLDPVMVSTAGSRLLDEDAIEAIREVLGRTAVITPNLPEAAVLLDVAPATDLDGMREQAAALRDLGAERVLLKGGHAEDWPVALDVWCDADGTVELTAPWVRTANTHGTGCTLSSAIAALAPGHDYDWLSATRAAKAWLTDALRHADALSVGAGAGPVHHFHALWPGAGQRTPTDSRSTS